MTVDPYIIIALLTGSVIVLVVYAVVTHKAQDVLYDDLDRLEYTLECFNNGVIAVIEGNATASLDEAGDIVFEWKENSNDE